jgi:hypothetical protein
VAAAGLDQRAVATGVGDEHAGRPLHEGLEDDGGEPRAVLVHQVGGHVERPGVVVPRRPHDPEPQRVEDVRPEAAGAHRQRADRVAVVGVAEGEVAGPVRVAEVGPVLEGDLDRLLDGRGAVGGEQEVGAVDRHDRRQRLGQLDDDPVAVAQQRGVGDLVELVPHRLVELGHPVAQRRHPQ